MKAVIVVLLSIITAVPAFAGAPANGTYKSTDIGGLMLPGRYSELWFGGKLSINNTLNEESWDGANLGTQWRWYCPWISAAPALLVNTVNGAGNGQKIWRVTYSGGYCWLDGAGPWAGGDAAYTATVNTWVAIVTETYANFVEVGTVRNHNASATFVGYNAECMALNVENIEKLSDTTHGPHPANFPNFWDWFTCSDVGTAGPGEWGDVDSITYSILGCETVSTKETTWGAVKSLYR
ncbi:MAG TPA: hypothetical protein VFX92_14775 [Candidatus Krumholzibacteria bacterium]|nr:hypothetical protein [Candidatus Krumholzibacteria bacterium]